MHAKVAEGNEYITEKIAKYLPVFYLIFFIKRENTKKEFYIFHDFFMFLQSKYANFEFLRSMDNTNFTEK